MAGTPSPSTISTKQQRIATLAREAPEIGTSRNSFASGCVRVTKTWRKWLARRSQRGMDWERFNRMMRAFPLPTPVVIHSYQRHAAKP